MSWLKIAKLRKLYRPTHPELLVYFFEPAFYRKLLQFYILARDFVKKPTHDTIESGLKFAY